MFGYVDDVAILVNFPSIMKINCLTLKHYVQEKPYLSDKAFHISCQLKLGIFAKSGLSKMHLCSEIWALFKGRNTIL